MKKQLPKEFTSKLEESKRVFVINERDVKTGELSELDKVELTPCFRGNDPEAEKDFMFDRWLNDSGIALMWIGKALSSKYTLSKESDMLMGHMLMAIKWGDHEER